MAAYTDLSDLSRLSIRQLVKSYHYADQFTSDWDREFWRTECVQVKLEIMRRIAR